MVFSPSADVLVVRPLGKKRQFFPNGRTTKTSAEGENTIGCWYNLDLLMMGLWGLKHVEERRQQLLYENKKAVYQVGSKEQILKKCVLRFYFTFLTNIWAGAATFFRVWQV